MKCFVSSQKRHKADSAVNKKKTVGKTKQSVFKMQIVNAYF